MFRPHMDDVTAHMCNDVWKVSCFSVQSSVALTRGEKEEQVVWDLEGKSIFIVKIFENQSENSDVKK